MAKKSKGLVNDQTLKTFKHPDKYGEWMGYEVESIDRVKKEGVTTIELRDDHLSLAGNVHGGVISGFFDTALAVACFSTLAENESCATIELKVNYFKPLKSGDVLSCHAKVMFRGRRICTVHGLLYRKGEESPVAMATATFNVFIRT
ncbi:MAG: PaaI family thioesterase [Bacteriovoracia bacterium]